MKATAIFALLGVLAFAIFLAAQEQKQSAQPISLSEIHERGIEGKLGVRLGEIVEVAGVVVPNESKEKSDLDIPFFLSIKSVDGRALKRPVRFAFAPFDTDVVQAPAVGENFRYMAYETGQFDGAPSRLFDYVPPVATTGYSFQTELVILGPPKSKKP